jgi:hypothetical protein
MKSGSYSSAVFPNSVYPLLLYVAHLIQFEVKECRGMVVWSSVPDFGHGPPEQNCQVGSKQVLKRCLTGIKLVGQEISVL